MRGTVRWFSNQRGYGFITDSDGKDVFVHYSGIANVKGFKTLAESDAVEFDVIDAEKGRQAVNVMVVESNYTKFETTENEEEEEK